MLTKPHVSPLSRCFTFSSQDPTKPLVFSFLLHHATDCLLHAMIIAGIVRSCCCTFIGGNKKKKKHIMMITHKSCSPFALFFFFFRLFFFLLHSAVVFSLKNLGADR